MSEPHSLSQVRPVRAQSLGATLYTPATYPRLKGLLAGELLPQQRSLVICTEDAIAQSEISAALDHLSSTLDQLDTLRPQTFIRVRDLETLRTLIKRGIIKRFQGVVLPKVDEENVLSYGDLLAELPHLDLMPTIEGEVAFYRARLERLRDAFSMLANPILCIRVGGNDLFQHLGIKRPPHFTIYETPLRSTLNDLIITLRPAGYELSAPVFDYLQDAETLRREVEMDIAYGLLTKTAIHPHQVPVIEQSYQVRRADFELASSILDAQAPAVFQMDRQMCEPSTHRAWAERTHTRASLFGVKSHSLSAH